MFWACLSYGDMNQMWIKNQMLKFVFCILSSLLLLYYQNFWNPIKNNKYTRAFGIDNTYRYICLILGREQFIVSKHSIFIRTSCLPYLPICCITSMMHLIFTGFSWIRIEQVEFEMLWYIDDVLSLFWSLAQWKGYYCVNYVTKITINLILSDIFRYYMFTIINVLIHT